MLFLLTSQIFCLFLRLNLLLHLNLKMSDNLQNFSFYLILFVKNSFPFIECTHCRNMAYNVAEAWRQTGVSTNARHGRKDRTFSRIVARDCVPACVKRGSGWALLFVICVVKFIILTFHIPNFLGQTVLHLLQFTTPNPLSLVV